MTEEKELTGWERSRAAQKGYGNFYAGLAIATVLIAGVWIGSRIFAAPDSSAFGMNLWTEGLGILVTVGLFGLISQWLAEERYKRQLVDEAASTSNETAKHAIHVMRRRGWIRGKNSILQKADLASANLASAILQEANLDGVNLLGARLQNANLRSASLIEAILTHSNLSHAELSDAKLQRAKLFHANLYQADLQAANLDNAILRGANLEGANLTQSSLRGAALRGANLKDAIISVESFDTQTWLPDGTYWKPDVDVQRFTDARRVDFWYSTDPTSPASRENVLSLD